MRFLPVRAVEQQEDENDQRAAKPEAKILQVKVVVDNEPTVLRDTNLNSHLIEFYVRDLLVKRRIIPIFENRLDESAVVISHRFTSAGQPSKTPRLA